MCSARVMARSCGKIFVAKQSPHKETSHHCAAYHRVERPPVCPAGQRITQSEPLHPVPAVLGVVGSLRATLIYLHHNLPQAAIGELLGVSQPTVSRAVKALTELVTRALDGYLVTAEEVVPNCDLCPGRNSSAPLELEGPPRAVVGQALAHLDECPGLGYLRRSPGVGLRSLPGLDPRCRRPGRFRPARGPRPRRMGRRQGLHR